MERGPLQSEWWKKTAKKFVPYVNISAQISDKPDQGLLRAIGARSYPTCVIMDSQGKVILRNDTAGAFRPTSETRLRGSLEVVQELIDLRVAVEKDSGDAASRGALQIVESILEIQSTPLERLDQLIEQPGISDSLKQRYQRWRGVKPISQVLQEYVAIIRTIPKSDAAGRGREFQIAAGKMLAIHRQGLELKDPRVGIYSDYWRLVFEGALAQRDLKVTQKALGIYRKAFGSRPNLKSRIDRMSQRVGELQKSLEKKNLEKNSSEKNSIEKNSIEKADAVEPRDGGRR